MKMFQIHESDLAELEHMLPELCDVVTMTVGSTPRHRTLVRKVKSILSNVRWNYGPPSNVEVVDGN